MFEATWEQLVSSFFRTKKGAVAICCNGSHDTQQHDGLPASVFSGGELAAALSSMGAAERLEAIQQRVKRLAIDVVGEELSGDDPLLEFGAEKFSMEDIFLVV